ncbi:hypothetical protein DBB29_08535 [Pandoraea cepalis]|uniref:Uncharacterized protein n=1 Tax=Pandoraea cepalis TaxID=2508294 RepID=A0AAW7MLP7_9BURK|nr:hypothetical protein [Pandoraea cepalis]MDN4573619.1 hypothetical protein [Pandoraea cepalis]MDN4578161.1 hypothetical protein [Pandoraea cepalis]
MPQAPSSSKFKTTKADKRAAASARFRAWADRHTEDRFRMTLALVRSVVANVDREREAVDPDLTRTVYIGAALLAMEALPSTLRQAFIKRYAELHGEPVVRNQWSG